MEGIEVKPLTWLRPMWNVKHTEERGYKSTDPAFELFAVVNSDWTITVNLKPKSTNVKGFRNSAEATRYAEELWRVHCVEEARDVREPCAVCGTRARWRFIQQRWVLNGVSAGVVVSTCATHIDAALTRLNGQKVRIQEVAR